MNQSNFEQFHLWKIALRFFKRDYKRGELLVLLLSVIIAMASVSTIYLMINRIDAATNKEVSHVLGADLVISSPKPLEQNWTDFAQTIGLQQAKSVEFASVLYANEAFQLSSVKAISNQFPLNGHLEIAAELYDAGDKINRNPKSGEIWLEPRLFSQLDLKIGDKVEVGYLNLKVAGVLMDQPEQGTSLFNIAPTAMINIDDLEATKIIQPGSRINYRYLFSGETAALKQLTKKFNQEKNNSQTIRSVYDDSPIAGSALERSKKYLGLASLLTLILLGVSIAIATNRYIKKQFDTTALMRCFGLTSNQALLVFNFILLMVCFIGLFLGALLGFIVQEILVVFIGEFFASELPSAEMSSLLLPTIVTFILMFGFSLPALLQLKNISPINILRRQLQPIQLGSWLVYLISASALCFVMWLQVKDIFLLLSVLATLLIIILVFSAIGLSLLKLMKSLVNKNHPAVNFSLRQLDANKGTTLLNLLAFSITFFIILLIILIRTELLEQWQKSFAKDTPNHFLVNIKPTESKSINAFFSQHNIQFSGLYPMVRGRLVGLNGEDIKTVIPSSGLGHNSLRRELNMTWTDDLPLGNQVIQGDWQWPKDDKAIISIEEGTAEALDLNIGDELNFKIGADDWQATIGSIRKIDWQTMSPNFYIIARPGSLDAFSPAYMTSFYLSPSEKKLLASFVRQYPSVTVIEIDKILQEIQDIIQKVSKAIELIMVFLVVAGIALLRSTMIYSFDNKLKQSAILRTLGASQGFIKRCFRFEYVWLALLSAVMVMSALELVAYLLYTRFFEIAFEFHTTLWLVMPIVMLVLMLGASWQGARKVTQVEPLALIKSS